MKERQKGPTGRGLVLPRDLWGGAKPRPSQNSVLFCRKVSFHSFLMDFRYIKANTRPGEYFVFHGKRYQNAGGYIRPVYEMSKVRRGIWLQARDELRKAQVQNHRFTMALRRPCLSRAGAARLEAARKRTAERIVYLKREMKTLSRS